MKKLTAVKWLIEVIKDSIDAEDGSVSINWLHDGTLDKAKELEKEQIINSYNKGTVNGIDYPKSNLPLVGEQYYNETFNQAKS